MDQENVQNEEDTGNNKKESNDDGDEGKDKGNVDGEDVEMAPPDYNGDKVEVDKKDSGEVDNGKTAADASEGGQQADKQAVKE